jgi:hypothetical protein
VRSKNAKNIILKNLLDACIGSISFYLIGYGFAYTGQGGGNSFIAWGAFALHNAPRNEYYNWFFQFAVRCRHPPPHSAYKLGMYREMSELGDMHSTRSSRIPIIESFFSVVFQATRC